MKSSEHSYDIKLSQQLWSYTLLLLKKGKITVMEGGTSYNSDGSLPNVSTTT